jgi:hypothetical protein
MDQSQPEFIYERIGFKRVTLALISEKANGNTAQFRMDGRKQAGCSFAVAPPPFREPSRDLLRAWRRVVHALL